MDRSDDYRSLDLSMSLSWGFQCQLELHTRLTMSTMVDISILLAGAQFFAQCLLMHPRSPGLGDEKERS